MGINMGRTHRFENAYMHTGISTREGSVDTRKRRLKKAHVT